MAGGTTAAAGSRSVEVKAFPIQCIRGIGRRQAGGKSQHQVNVCFAQHIEYTQLRGNHKVSLNGLIHFIKHKKPVRTH